MINKDDLDVSTLRVLDQLDLMDAKLNALLDAHKISGSKVFDANQVCKMLGNISESTLWRYRKYKGLKSFKGNQGRRYFRYEDIMAFICGK